MIFSPTAYAALYFIWIFSAIISGVNVSIYIAEIYTSKWRYVSYIVSAFPVAQLVTSLIMYLNRTYTGIHLWGGISSMVILLFYFLIPESPRWLAQNRKEKDALKVFIYMAKVRIQNFQFSRSIFKWKFSFSRSIENIFLIKTSPKLKGLS